MGTYYIGNVPCSGNDIYHYGRKGMKWGKNIFGKISEFFTGNNARRELNRASAAERGANTQHRLASKYDYNDVDNNGSVLNRASKDDYYAREQRAAAQAAYNNTHPGMAEKARQQAQEAMAKAREQVSNAYADAAEKAGGAGKNIQAFYSDVMAKAKATINQGKQAVSKYGGQYASQIEEIGKNALTGGKNFLEGIMNRAKGAAKSTRDKVTGEVSKFKARDAEKRDREREIGKQDTHDMLAKRRNETQKYYKTDNKFMKETGWDQDIDRGAPGRTRLADERDGRGYYPNSKFTPQGLAKIRSMEKKNKKK